jgi:hypothetical protein
MKKSFTLLAILALLAAQGMSLKAQKISDSPAGVSFWLPDDWEVDSDEDGYTSADAPDSDAYCVLQVLPDATDLGAALDSYADLLADEIDDFASTAEDRRGEVNGMPAVFISGEGKRDDADWVVSVALVATGKAVLMLSFGWEKGMDTNFASLKEKVVNSLRKLE